MISAGNRNAMTNWGAMLLPTLAVVLFQLLHMKLQTATPTAGGLSFLVTALVAFFFFPKLRVRLPRLVLALALAALVAALLGLMM
jgi:UDP-N-acetylmuramyl pentapeptide phosphotransferase/UDP-N-acetylglucosamine-1-phosphate transferase